MKIVIQVVDDKGQPVKSAKVRAVVWGVNGASDEHSFEGEVKGGGAELAEASTVTVAAKGTTATLFTKAEVEPAKISAVDATTDTLAVAATSRTVRIDDAVTSTATQIDTARTAVSSSGVSVGDVKLTLRGTATTTDSGAVALDLGTSVGTADTLSTLEASYTPTAPVVAAAVTDGPVLPDLAGYTPAMAGRKLASLGLGSRIVGYSVAPDSPDLGRVVRTVPAPGTAVSTGTAIRLFIGKA